MKKIDALLYGLVIAGLIIALNTIMLGGGLMLTKLLGPADVTNIQGDYTTIKKVSGTPQTLGEVWLSDNSDIAPESNYDQRYGPIEAGGYLILNRHFTDVDVNIQDAYLYIEVKSSEPNNIGFFVDTDCPTGVDYASGFLNGVWTKKGGESEVYQTWNQLDMQPGVWNQIRVKISDLRFINQGETDPIPACANQVKGVWMLHSQTGYTNEVSHLGYLPVYEYRDIQIQVKEGMNKPPNVFETAKQFLTGLLDRIKGFFDWLLAGEPTDLGVYNVGEDVTVSTSVAGTTPRDADYSDGTVTYYYLQYQILRDGEVLTDSQPFEIEDTSYTKTLTVNDMQEGEYKLVTVLASFTSTLEDGVWSDYTTLKEDEDIQEWRVEASQPDKPQPGVITTFFTGIIDNLRQLWGWLFG